MADRRGDTMRQQQQQQQPFATSQERVFDGGGGGGGGGQAFGGGFDHGSYMSLVGATGVNPQQPAAVAAAAWAVEEVTAAAPVISLTPQFSMANYAQPTYQQHAALVSPLAAGAGLHPFRSYLHGDPPPPQWPPPRATSSSTTTSLPPPSFAVFPSALAPPHQQLLHAAAVIGGGGGGSQAAAAAAAVAIEQPAKDGYNWRKYGQKQLKDAESPRSYYKCTRDGCPVKKIVERSFDGCIKEITYKGRHSHPRPVEPRRGHGTGGGDDAVVAGGAGSEEDDGTLLEEDDDDDDHDRDAGGDAGPSVVKKPKIIIQTPSEVDLLDDGYRWRKYGQKVVKGNPRPRSYYKCTADHCNVRKQIERSSADPRCVLTTYTGRHSHDAPGRGAGGGASSAGPVVPMAMDGSRGGMFQQHGGAGACRRLKEEGKD